MQNLIDKARAWITESLTHLKWGAAAALALALLLAVALFVHPAIALAVAGPLFGWALERYQAIRREGVASKRDIVATAIPFEAAAAVWALLL